MPDQLQTVLISALVAILTAASAGFFTWKQIQREREKWLTELKTTWQTEVFKERLKSYPRLYAILAQLSVRATPPPTPEQAAHIGQQINDWYYSIGGLCADVDTRAAVYELREACFAWKQGELPANLLKLRNITVFFLRRDLDIQGLENFDLSHTTPLLEKLKAEMTPTKERSKIE